MPIAKRHCTRAVRDAQRVQKARRIEQGRAGRSGYWRPGMRARSQRAVELAIASFSTIRQWTEAKLCVWEYWSVGGVGGGNEDRQAFWRPAVASDDQRRDAIMAPALVLTRLSFRSARQMPQPVMHRKGVA